MRRGLGGNGRHHGGVQRGTGGAGTAASSARRSRGNGSGAKRPCPLAGATVRDGDGRPRTGDGDGRRRTSMGRPGSPKVGMEIGAALEESRVGWSRGEDGREIIVAKKLELAINLCNS